LRAAESRGFIVGNRFPVYDNALNERFRRSQFTGQLCESNLRSKRGSVLMASIS